MDFIYLALTALLWACLHGLVVLCDSLGARP